MITHLELDILECEVKWALGSITTNKASGGDGILVELFQILKDDVWKNQYNIVKFKNKIKLKKEEMARIHRRTVQKRSSRP